MNDPPGASAYRRTLGERLRAGMDSVEPLVEWVIRGCGWSAIFFVFAIFIFIFKEAVFDGDGHPALLDDLNLTEFFASSRWVPEPAARPSYGILAMICGSLSVTVLAMSFAVPIGLGAAVFISEFATGKFKEALKVLIELLAAIPSVVWGFIGMKVMGPLIISVTGQQIGMNVLNGGMILAMMSVPLIVSLAEDALRAVPDSYREAAAALGASRWETVYKVLFPAAKSGLLAAVLLGVGRAIGETMAVLMATGHALVIPDSIFDPVRTMTATIAAEMGETPANSEHYRMLFMIGIVLFAITLFVNLTADLIVRGIRGESRD